MSKIEIKDWVVFARTYTPHPVAALFPMLSHKELEELADDILAYGQTNPIVLDDKMRVIDGRNRLAAMLLHHEDMPKPHFVSFADVKPIKCDGAAEYIVSTNIRRRHLSDEKRAVICAEAQKHYRYAANAARSKKMLDNQNAGKNSRVEINTTVLEQSERSLAELEAEAITGCVLEDLRLKPERTWERIAETAGVSQHKARQALAVVADAPELASKVVSGEVKLSDAAKHAKAARQASAPKATPVGKAKPRKRKALALEKAKTLIWNHNADMLAKVSDEDTPALRQWIAQGSKLC